MQSGSEASKIPDGSEADVPMTDHGDCLMRVALHEDRDAFAALFAHFGPRVKSLMLKAGADQALADDLVQDVMMTVWRKAHLYAPERGAVGTWIYTIARNARIDFLRRGSSQPYEDLEAVEVPCENADSEEEVFANQRVSVVAEAVAELPDEQRAIIEYAFMHDLSQSQIAAKLALPLGTVKSRLRLAYAKLKGRLEEVQ